MKNMKIKIVLGLIIFISIVVIVGWSQYNKPHVDVNNVKADYILSADRLIGDYSINEMAADEKYVGKIIEIMGNVSSVSVSNGNGVITFLIQGYETGITCNFQSNENTKVVKLKTNQFVTVKGICTGMLLDIMMKECVVVE